MILQTRTTNLVVLFYVLIWYCLYTDNAVVTSTMFRTIKLLSFWTQYTKSQHTTMSPVGCGDTLEDVICRLKMIYYVYKNVSVFVAGQVLEHYYYCTDLALSMESLISYTYFSCACATIAGSLNALHSCVWRHHQRKWDTALARNQGVVIVFWYVFICSLFARCVRNKTMYVFLQRNVYAHRKVIFWCFIFIFIMRPAMTHFVRDGKRVIWEPVQAGT